MQTHVLPNPYLDVEKAVDCSWCLQCDGVHSVLILCLQDCLRACQEQIESLLESSLRQAQQHSGTTETKRVDEDVDLSCTPTDVRDINIWNDRQPRRTMTWWSRESCRQRVVTGGLGSGRLIWTQPPLLLLLPGGLLRWPRCHSHARCPLRLPRWDRVPPGRPPPRNKPQVTFPASVPSHPGKRNEHYRNVQERKKTRILMTCVGWSWSHKADILVDIFSYSLKY